MKLDDAVGELGALSVLSIAHGISPTSAFAADISAALPAPLPTGAISLRDRLTSVVEYIAAEVLPTFRRVVLAGPELIALEALAAAGCSLPVHVALPSGASPELQERVAHNLPADLDSSVISIPTNPDGQVSATQTLLLVPGFDGGGGTYLVSLDAAAALEFYRSQFLFEALLVNPLERAVHSRTALFRVVSSRLIDRVVRFESDPPTPSLRTDSLETSS